MDVNGTKFHLLLGRADWGRCGLAQQGKTLSEIWEETNTANSDFDWDGEADEITLQKHLFKFAASPKDTKPKLDNRRGAARDRYGNWYWIDETGLKIKVLSTGSNTVSDLYPFATRDRAQEIKSDFQPVEISEPKMPVKLCGLAVTIDHYLVVGTCEPTGLLVFDLFSAGEPRRILWRDEVKFIPFDITARYSGGVFVLDRDNKRYRTLGRGFEIVKEEAANEKKRGRHITKDHFQPLDKAGEQRYNQRFSDDRIFSNLKDSIDPISIEALPDDTVLILDLPQENEDFSVLRRYYRGQKLHDLPTGSTSSKVGKKAKPSVSSPPDEFQLRGYDIAFVKGDEGEKSETRENEKYDRLYIVSEEGNQAFAFRMICEDELASSVRRNLPPYVVGKKLKLELIKEYFPMRLYSGKGFSAADGKVYFDFGERWLPLIKQNRPSFITRGILDTPVFDSREPNCVWHRLMLDGCISPETRIKVYSRAGNDLPDSWQSEPNLYFRGNGSEIPFPGGCISNENGRKTWEFELQQFKNCVSKEKGKGTWELLLQKAKGRYLQLRLVFSGNGRQTPRISALRAHYPRFSYLDNYVPSIYREDGQSAFFLDRFLANFEGFYTTIEDKIASVQMLFDVRSAPPDALDWLANWFGVALDPAWTEDKRRLFISHAVEFFQYRGTMRGLRTALRLALDSCADERIFDLQTREQKKRDPIRIVERFLTRRTPEIIPADFVEEQNLPRITQETSRWTPKQGADVLHQRYRKKLAEKLARELSANVRSTTFTGKIEEILKPIYAELKANPAKKTDVLDEKLQKIPSQTFALIRPGDAGEALLWESFARETLGFVPSNSAAKEQKSWQDFLSGKYTTIATLNAAHDTNYSLLKKPGDDGFRQVFLPNGTETNTRLKTDWQDFLARTTNSNRDRKLWQDFLARRYQRMGLLNDLFGTNWSSFETVSLFDRLPVLVKPLGDWVQFESAVLPMHLTAHRFTVLIPATLSGAKHDTPEEQNRKLKLVKRVIDLEKPAHTIFDFRYYWNLFRVEEVRLGLDTLLGLGSRDPQLNPTLIVGESYVGESRLGLQQPEKYSNRFVLDSENLIKTKNKKDEKL
jgi:phage tail-like protein